MTYKGIDISVSGDAMTIRGEKKIEHEEQRKGIYMSERPSSTFYRTIPLPAGVDAEKAEAQAKVKRIAVKAGCKG